MTISIRFDDDTANRLEEAARAQSVSKSEIVRQSVAAFLESDQSRAERAWELGKDVFGKYGSGRSDVSENTERYLGEIFDAKQRDR